MSTIHKIFILLIVLVFGACKKIELPPGVQEDPVFSVNASLGGEPLDLVAGENEYYMFTSFAKDDLDVFSFIGRFEKTIDKTNSPPISLEFEIRDVGTSVVTSPNINEALAPKSYPFVGSMMDTDTVLTGYEVRIENRSISNMPLAYQWTFSNGEVFEEENPAPVFFPLSGNMNYWASLGVSGSGVNGECFEAVNKDVNLQQNAFPDCRLNYTLEPDTLLFNICGEMQGQAPFTFEWTADSTHIGECLDISNLNNVDSIRIALQGTDAAGCTENINIAINYSAGNSIDYCTADFAYAVNPQYQIVAPMDSFFFSQVIIRYVDRDGTLFSTDKIPQPTTSNFQILESSDYLPNENEEKTRQLSIRFSAVLHNDAGEELLLENGTAIIAVAYP